MAWNVLRSAAGFLAVEDPLPEPTEEAVAQGLSRKEAELVVAALSWQELVPGEPDEEDSLLKAMSTNVNLLAMIASQDPAGGAYFAEQAKGHFRALIKELRKLEREKLDRLALDVHQLTPTSLNQAYLLTNRLLYVAAAKYLETGDSEDLARAVEAVERLERSNDAIDA